MPKNGQTVGSIYELAVSLGRAADPRGEERVQEILELEGRTYQELSTEKKSYFDTEALTNPYPDTRILYGNRSTPVATVLVGIDMDSAELLVADRLRDRNTKIDAVIAHHPEGIGLAQLDAQLMLQTDLLASYGVPIHVAESLLEKRIAELGRALSPINHNRAVDTARLLEMPFICTHTATDNLVYGFLKQFVTSRKPKTVDDIMAALMTLPEYQAAAKLSAGPHIVSGNGKRRVGNIAFTDITGGTSGAKEAYSYLSRNGIGTILAMHMKEEHKKVAEEAHLNVIVAGHMSSDSLGMNLMLDQLEATGVRIIPTGGLIRVSRPISKANNQNKATTSTRKKGAR